MMSFLARDCRPAIDAMAAEPPPPRPPWKEAGTATVDQRNDYDDVLLLGIKVRDLKHAALVHHVSEHCQ